MPHLVLYTRNGGIWRASLTITLQPRKQTVTSRFTLWLVGPEQKVIEIQIRSADMHDDAELGVAAHWLLQGGSNDRQSSRV